jgi:cytidine deaminase
MSNKIIIEFANYASSNELAIPFKLLLEAARQAAHQAYNPYSKFYVGCAVATNTGKIYTGFNIENAAYSTTICAERTTLSSTITKEPQAIITAIAISTFKQDNKNDKPAFPCGTCRQFIAEIEDRNQKLPIPIILGGQIGEVLIFNSIKDLLPFSFTKSNLLED